MAGWLDELEKYRKAHETKKLTPSRPAIPMPEVNLDEEAVKFGLDRVEQVLVLRFIDSWLFNIQVMNRAGLITPDVDLLCDYVISDAVRAFSESSKLVKDLLTLSRDAAGQKLFWEAIEGLRSKMAAESANFERTLASMPERPKSDNQLAILINERLILMVHLRWLKRKFTVNVGFAAKEAYAKLIRELAGFKRASAERVKAVMSAYRLGATREKVHGYYIELIGELEKHPHSLDAVAAAAQLVMTSMEKIAAPLRAAE